MNYVLIAVLMLAWGCRNRETHEANSQSVIMDAHTNAVMEIAQDDSEDVMRRLKLKVITWDQLDLNRQGVSVGKDALGSKHGLKYPGRNGFIWEKGDGDTGDWYPQGIAGLRTDQRHTLIISWYGKESAAQKGVRLSFVDVKTLKYRHVLLVESGGAGKVKPLLLHAGGIAVVGHMIYVADTTRGVRMFDANKIFQVTDTDHKDAFGEGAGGKFGAYSYLYVMPQIKRFTTSGRRFSYLATDWTNKEAPVLISGNYKTGSDKAPDLRRVHAWNMNGEDVGSLKWDTHNTFGVEAPTLVQGAAVLDDFVFMVTSGGSAKLQVGKLQPKNLGIKTYAMPHGIEDIYMDPNTNLMWTLTEHPGARIVFPFEPLKYIEDWKNQHNL